ncbi:MAG: Asp-tRNA(Asn)/Glu-tRNA(Gln) amidotransferase GatCAB subunit C [candidate division Zixibacteria bacterium]|nr:Asp-tRNA(Asn)/Glu-tRNA(Gln) amidotransferase GatCAB subunit C [candidate division Zixibacteria bacterium]
MGAYEERIEVIRRMIREAYLALPGEEEEKLAKEVVGLLDNVELLAALEVEEGPPPPAVEPAELREDLARPSLPLPRALANAPDTHDAFVAVPKILATEEKGDKP